MIDRPEQCYTIDNWPSEQERATMFRVVSEIPVLSETLHQVLMISQALPDDMYLHMLRVLENLMKLAALVHIKDIYPFRLHKVDAFVQTLFNICLYKYHAPCTLAVSVLYWRAWHILLIVSALDPKGFGLTAWQQYPTLRMLMEMIMTDDYAYPPLSSLGGDESLSAESFAALEAHTAQLERHEILRFENAFEAKQLLQATPQQQQQPQPIVRTEANSQLIGQVMRFEPSGVARRPPADTVQTIRKLNAEYKLGQLLCKSRQPDYLLGLIKRQTAKMSFTWLSPLIESSFNDCLDIMPIQCVCEYIWNVLNSNEEQSTKVRKISYIIKTSTQPCK